MSQLGMLWALGNLAEFRQNILIRAQNLRMEMHVHCFYCRRVSYGIGFQRFQFALFREFFCRRCNLHTLHLLGSLFICVICALGLHPLESFFCSTAVIIWYACVSLFEGYVLATLPLRMLCQADGSRAILDPGSMWRSAFKQGKACNIDDCYCCAAQRHPKYGFLGV